MKFSYSAVWDDLVAMARANASLLSALAGVFFFLPSLLMGYFVPQPAGAETISQLIADMEIYITENFHWLLLANLVNMLGAIAMYLLLFNPGGRTVGSAIGSSFAVLPFYFLLSMLTTAAILLGFVLFIIPGIYLMGRLMIDGAVMVAEGRRSPFAAISRSWRLTKGKGWVVAALILLVIIAGYIIIGAVTAVFGSVFILLLGREGLGGLLSLILASALSAAFSALLVLLFAAIYRRLESSADSSTSGT